METGVFESVTLMETLAEKSTNPMIEQGGIEAILDVIGAYATEGKVRNATSFLDLDQYYLNSTSIN